MQSLFKLFPNSLQTFFNTKDSTDKVMNLIIDKTSQNNKNNDSIQAALEIIKKKDTVIDFYRKYDFRGVKLSIIDYAFIKNKEMFYEILNHPTIQTSKSHDMEFFFERLIYSRDDNDLKNIIMNFINNYIFTSNELLESEIKFSNLDNVIKERFSFYFDNFPEHEAWRLFCDLEKQQTEHGWVEYEQRESGFLIAMSNAFSHIRKTIEEPLSIELIKKLHQITSTKVKNLQKGIAPGEFRSNTEASFNIHINSNASLRGLLELMNGANQEKFYIDHGVSAMLYCPPRSIEAVEDDVQNAVTNYYIELERAKNPKQKLLAIIHCISMLERLHPFGDCNCRLFCILILQRELIRNGFSPVILEDPNRFDCFSDEELIMEILRGEEAFNNVKAGNLKNMGLQTDEVLEYIENIDSSFAQPYHEMIEIINENRDFSALTQSVT